MKNEEGRKRGLLPSYTRITRVSIPFSFFDFRYTIPVTFASALGNPLSSFCLKISSAIVR
jgi:hypothetical protein